MKYKFEDVRMSGWKKFFHKLFLFITFPIRKPIITIIVLLILFLAPVFLAKVTPRYVLNWYKEQILTNYHLVKDKVASNIQLPKTIEDGVKGIDKLVDVPAAAPKTARRKSFVKSTTVLRSAPPPGLEPINPNLEFVEEEVLESQPKALEDAVEAKVDDEAVKEELLEEVEKDVNEVDEAPLKSRHKIKTNLPLKYLITPQEISGTVKVVNANSIELDNTFMFFYGIYANPASTNGQKGEKLLKDTIEGKTINCSIVAYTYEDVPTAMCYVGTRSVNHVLVERGYSRNVALD